MQYILLPTTTPETLPPKMQIFSTKNDNIPFVLSEHPH